MRSVWKKTPPLQVLLAIAHRWKPILEESEPVQKIGPKEMFLMLAAKQHATGEAEFYG